MQHITTPSISTLESITPDLLAGVSGGCKRRKCAPPPPPPEPPPQPQPPPLPTIMAQPPQEQRMAGGPQVINCVTITTAGGTQQRVV
jgi:hypothetical protein